MIDLTKETWAVSPTDGKAHLYFPTKGSDTRRLCRHPRVLVADLSEPNGQDKCRMCLNIRNLIAAPGKLGVKR